uniref:Uncharacterized protein n=1 Tax=Ascaris lumbricoides TaxID=6252 RepID=A0A0M3IW94_ASCLU
MFGWSSPLSILGKVMIRSVIRGIVEFDMWASANIGGTVISLLISATDTAKMSTPTPNSISPISPVPTPQTPGSAGTPTPITSETDGKTPESVAGRSTTLLERSTVRLVFLLKNLLQH